MIEIKQPYRSFYLEIDDVHTISNLNANVYGTINME